LGFIGLILFGQVMPGYDDFGLGRDDDQDPAADPLAGDDTA
jgi:hypothetical protein